MELATLSQRVRLEEGPRLPQVVRVNDLAGDMQA